MKKYSECSITEKAAGERAVQRMSQKAREYYNGTDPLNVAEYRTDDGLRYVMCDHTGSYDGYTFAQLEKELESLRDTWEEDLD